MGDGSYYTQSNLPDNIKSSTKFTVKKNGETVASCTYANLEKTLADLALTEGGTYTITEVKPEKKTPGMTYSDEVITLTVYVNNAEDGTLSVDTVYTNGGVITNKYEPPVTYDYKFSFFKKWQGGVESSIEWTLYNPDGTVAHKKFNKEVMSETEWYYEAWFATNKGYYIIEDVPEGYTPIYVNVGEYADVTDRLHNGGTIINYKVPQTGDDSNLLLWGGLLAGSAALLMLLGIRRKRHGMM